MSIAIVAALPREIAGLVRGTKPDATLLRRKIHLHRVGSALVVAAGMGAVRASLAVEAVAEAGASILVSAGLAGACIASLEPGTVVASSSVIDVKTGERFAAEGASGEWVLVTSDSIASVREKRRLAAAYGAAIVDMEAATVGRLARARGLPFRAIKAVSDAHDFELESLAKFAGADGQFRTAAFALHTAQRPWEWRQATVLGSNSKRALVALTERLRTVIAEG